MNDIFQSFSNSNLLEEEILCISKFEETFSNFPEDYILIGGSACRLLFNHYGNQEFRKTRDFDVVVTSNSKSPLFLNQLKDFIAEGQYSASVRQDNGKPTLYRFTTKKYGFPKMIELLTFISDYDLGITGTKTKLTIEDRVTSFSAIVLNKEYLDVVKNNVIIIDGIPTLAPQAIIILKMKAWLQLTEETQTEVSTGKHIHSHDIKKHIDDVINIALKILRHPDYISEFPNHKINLPPDVIMDIKMYIRLRLETLSKLNYDKLDKVQKAKYDNEIKALEILCYFFINIEFFRNINDNNLGDCIGYEITKNDNKQNESTDYYTDFEMSL